MSWAVLDEHYSYLSLPGRNASYAEAIRQVIRPGDVVADLGCGVGILGLLCLRAGAARVYGVDHSEAIEIAAETARREGLSDRYFALSGSTFQTELPEMVDVLICDHVGFFGFDYGIIEMLADARRRMLKPGGRIIPEGLQLVMAGAMADRCRSKIDGWTMEPVPREYHWLREYSVNLKHHASLAAEELCTVPVTIANLDFAGDIPETLAFDFRLTVTRDGLLDGLSGWFDSRLGGDVWMTNSPLSPRNIGRYQAFFPCDTRMPVRTGDELAVSLRIRHQDHIISWSIGAPGQGRQKMSTWKSRILRKAEIGPQESRPLALSRAAIARKTVLDLVDGRRSANEIEEAVLRNHADLQPSEAEIRRFVHQVLSRDTE